STTASSGLRIGPILEVLSPAGNGSPKALSLNKTTTEHDPPPPPAIGPSRDPEATPGPPLWAPGDGSTKGGSLPDRYAGGGCGSSRLGPTGSPPTRECRSLPTGRGSCPRLPRHPGHGLRGRAVSPRTAAGKNRHARRSDSLSAPQGDGSLQGHR